MADRGRVVHLSGGVTRRRDGRPVTYVRRHWRDYPAPNPQPRPCKIWEGALDKNGYGVMTVKTVSQAGGKQTSRKVFAHRWIWEAARGPIPPGMVVRHKCDNPPCINLVHLELGTIADNNRDAQERGHLGPSWKLRPSQVRELFDLWETGEWTKVALGRHFKISEFAVRSYIKKGRDGFPHVWDKPVAAPKPPKRLKHSDWRDQ